MKGGLEFHRLNLKRNIELLSCTGCLTCVEMCPVFEETGSPEVTPFYKIKKINKIRSSKIFKILWKKGKEETETFREFLYKCSVCGQCAFVCPSRIDTIEMWENVREIFVGGGYGPLPSQNPLIQSIKNYDNPWMSPRSQRRKWADRGLREGRLSRRVKDLSGGREKAEILYFVGCTASYDQNIKEIALNFAEILNRAGIDYGILGPEEFCCGSTPLRMGAVEVFKGQVEKNVEKFKSLGVEIILTSCSGCFKTLKQDYPKITHFPFKVYHMTQFVYELITNGKINLKNKIDLTLTYHDPCHLGRHNGIFDEPREILKSIKGIKLIEMERSHIYSRCCGAGGGLKAGFREVQINMSLKRVQDAVKTGAQEFVTACPFCYQSLLEAINTCGSKLKMRDITEIVMMGLL